MRSSLSSRNVLASLDSLGRGIPCLAWERGQGGADTVVGKPLGMAGSEEGNGFRQLELETELGKADQEGDSGLVPIPHSSFRLHLTDTSTFLSPLAASTRPKRVFMKKWTRDKGDGVGHELLPGRVFPPTQEKVRMPLQFSLVNQLVYWTCLQSMSKGLLSRSLVTSKQPYH